MDRYSRDDREENAKEVSIGDKVEIMWDQSIGFKKVKDIIKENGKKVLLINYSGKRVRVMADQVSRIC